jgi:hypothetical protein
MRLQLYDMRTRGASTSTRRMGAARGIAEPRRARAGRERRWYGGAIVRGGWRVFATAGRSSRPAGVRPARPFAAASAVLAACAIAAGCGGTRQDAHEPSKTFELQVVHASFAAKQAVARPETMTIEVKNSGSATVPNVAVTVDSFVYQSNYPGLAATTRPVWAVENGPGLVATPPVESEEVSKGGSAGTAYVNTWALGALPSGQTKTFRWQVVAVKAGSRVVHYSVAAGLAGKAHATASSGSLQGQFPVDIAAAPEASHVNPSTGKVEPGSAPTSP